MDIRDLRVIVLGGSIGGTSIARRLLEEGADVQVFERSPHLHVPRGGGLGIDLDLVQAVVGKGIEALPHLLLVGRRLAGPHHVYDEPGPLRVTAYQRLQRFLAAGIPQDRWHLGRAATRVEDLPAGSEVEFEDGGREPADLVIHAEGVHSPARADIAHDPAPRYAGYVLWRGIIERSAMTARHPTWQDDRLHVVSRLPYHLVAYPIPGRDTSEPSWINWGWYFGVSTNDLPELMQDRSGRRGLRSVGFGQVPDVLQAPIKDLAPQVWPEPYAELVQQTSALGVHPIYESRPDRLGVGRRVLLGDAAHAASPITGSGARMAMEDALTLNQALRNAATVQEALASYERLRGFAGRQVVTAGQRHGALFRKTGTRDYARA